MRLGPKIANLKRQIAHRRLVPIGLQSPIRSNPLHRLEK
jgi:hypothetical protein